MLRTLPTKVAVVQAEWRLTLTMRRVFVACFLPVLLSHCLLSCLLYAWMLGVLLLLRSASKVQSSSPLLARHAPLSPLSVLSSFVRDPIVCANARSRLYPAECSVPPLCPSQTVHRWINRVVIGHSILTPEEMSRTGSTWRNWTYKMAMRVFTVITRERIRD